MCFAHRFEFAAISKGLLETNNGLKSRFSSHYYRSKHSENFVSRHALKLRGMTTDAEVVSNGVSVQLEESYHHFSNVFLQEFAVFRIKNNKRKTSTRISGTRLQHKGDCNDCYRGCRSS